MKMQSLLKIAFGLSLLTMAHTAYADAVISYQASVIADCSKLSRCPLISGDVLWNEESSRSALPLDNGMLFLGLNTHTTILSLTKNLKAFELNEGTLQLRVWQISSRQIYRIKTGKLTLSIKQSGNYRIDVSPNGRETTIRVIEGRAEVRINNIAQVIRKGETFKYTNNMLPIYSRVSASSFDDDYYFSQSFLSSYYHQYPESAPPARYIPKYISGPKVEIRLMERPVVIYEQPSTHYRQSVIVRDPRYRSEHRRPGKAPYVAQSSPILVPKNGPVAAERQAVSATEGAPSPSPTPKNQEEETEVKVIVIPQVQPVKPAQQKTVPASGVVPTPAPTPEVNSSGSNEKAVEQNVVPAPEVKTSAPSEKPVEQKIAPSSEVNSSGSSDKAVKQNAESAPEVKTSVPSEKPVEKKIVAPPAMNSSGSSEKAVEQNAESAPEVKSSAPSEKPTEIQAVPSPETASKTPVEQKGLPAPEVVPSSVPKNRPAPVEQKVIPAPEAASQKPAEQKIAPAPKNRPTPAEQKTQPAPEVIILVPVERKLKPSTEPVPVDFNPVPVPLPKQKLKEHEVPENES